MKTILLLLALIGLSGCQQMERKRLSESQFATPRSKAPAAAREDSSRFHQTDTERRAKAYENKGYTGAEALALAEAEYFRSGR